VPTILRFRGFNILIYTLDHAPAHVHAKGKGVEAIFFLNCSSGSVVLRTRDRTTMQEEVTLARFISENRHILCKAWEEIHVTQEEHDLAEDRGCLIRESGRCIVAAHYDPASRTMHVTFKAGFTISFAKERSQVTAAATDEELAVTEISPAGWSVDFPRLDDGLTAEGLLAGRFGNTQWEREWAAKHQSVAA
jgi:hypothetical protein